LKIESTFETRQRVNALRQKVQHMYSKADTHIHTRYSDGLMTPEETVAAIAGSSDLRVIAITDHDTIEGAVAGQQFAQCYAPQLEVIIGQEVSTDEGDVVGLFLEATLPRFKTALAAIEAIHAQNGLAVAVHPFSRWTVLGLMHGVSWKIFQLPFDAVEVQNGFPGNLVNNPLTVWLNRRVGQQLPELGGSDSHAPITAGQPYTCFPGSTAADLRRAIEQGNVRAAGRVWSPASIVRLMPLLLQHGLAARERSATSLANGYQPSE
jgi:hypothetical protein